MRVAVIVLNYNGKKDTLECLHSLKRAQQHSHFSIIVVDNGSKDESLKTLRETFPEELYIDNQKNLGYAEGNNRGIVYALESNFDAICLLNNDTVVDPLFMQELLSLHAKNDQAILGATPLLYKERDRLDHLGGVWNPSKALFDLVGSRKLLSDAPMDFEKKLDYVCGCCMFIPKAVFKKIGLFDARFFLFWEESDFCQRAFNAGFPSLCAPKALLWHKVSASFSGKKPHTSYYFWRNRLLWMQKHKPPQHKLRLFFDVSKVIRHYWLKKTELFFLRLFSSVRYKDKKEKFHLHRACCRGVLDYFLNRFYEGPSWLFEKKP